MILKKGDLCKHFKGKNLQEKNIYEKMITIRERKKSSC